MPRSLTSNDVADGYVLREKARLSTKRGHRNLQLVDSVTPHGRLAFLKDQKEPKVVVMVEGENAENVAKFIKWLVNNAEELLDAAHRDGDA